ncbi:hypothetical protein ANTQUA_LOCUS421 [Anthophora quadrimaculata]
MMVGLFRKFAGTSYDFKGVNTITTRVQLIICNFVELYSSAIRMGRALIFRLQIRTCGELITSLVIIMFHRILVERNCCERYNFPLEMQSSVVHLINGVQIIRETSNNVAVYVLL